MLKAQSNPVSWELHVTRHDPGETGEQSLRRLHHHVWTRRPWEATEECQRWGPVGGVCGECAREQLGWSGEVREGLVTPRQVRCD